MNKERCKEILRERETDIAFGFVGICRALVTTQDEKDLKIVIEAFNEVREEQYKEIQKRIVRLEGENEN